jgi:hypothetical protein
MAKPKVKYRLERDSGFVVENYNWAKPFSNFFPGIAGNWGVPLWGYYVSKNQAVCSVGVRDKDGQILPFESFNHACDSVGSRGFRTFARIDNGSVYEPFRKTANGSVTQKMTMTAGELILEEINLDLGVAFEVTYFALPDLPVGVFARHSRVRNLNRQRRKLDWIDGVCRVLPHGVGYERSKFVARHVEAMMGVELQKNAALFKLRQSAEDTERIEEVPGGNYYVALADGQVVDRDGLIVDPDRVFGDLVDFDYPWVFSDKGLRAIRSLGQATAARTPCAFTGLSRMLEPNDSSEIVTLLGYAPDGQAVKDLVDRVGDTSFLAAKRLDNQKNLAQIENLSFTVSGRPELDAYAGRNFLDNVIRGGLPLVVDTAKGKSAFYVFSRQNGDLERDYHWFVVEPSYLSQGTGHYRSVLQNRRCDTWFFPEVEDINLHTFMSLIQLDGYNPLEVGPQTYEVVDRQGFELWLRATVRSRKGASAHQELMEYASRPFSPGELIMEMERRDGGLAESRGEIVAKLLSFCRPGEVGGLHEGFWVDHWTYNLDLLDTYLQVYPDRLWELLVGRDDYTYFDNPDVILPRAEKTVLHDGERVRRYGAVVRDAKKVEAIENRSVDPYRARTKRGKGQVYETNLLVKLLTVLVNRMATLDPSGVGVEMEADKPGWNDSMNGLPSLFGSSLNETLELLRCARFMRQSIEELGEQAKASDTKQGGVRVPAELADLMESLKPLLRSRARARTNRAVLKYWEASNAAKERYRQETKYGVTGEERPVTFRKLSSFVGLCERLLEKIFEPGERSRAGDEVVNEKGLPHTYFVNEVTGFERTGGVSHQGHPLVEPGGWKQRPVKPFLEGPVHYMKVFPERAGDVYRAVRRSPLFDRKLKMYKSCENMSNEDPELGRAVGAYPRGWLENESIYLHMEYKYLLEILRSGLCDEYFEDIRTALVPFMDPKVHGRSILEGASFTVSSAFEDPKYHGQAFQPRLSGITCEFVHAWTLMVAGPQPFGLGPEGGLELALEPRLPGWLFTRTATTRNYHDPVDGWREVRIPKGCFAFKLLGRCLVTYRNGARLPTYGKRGVGVTSLELHRRDGGAFTIDGPVVPSPYAERVREGGIHQIVAYLGSE